MSKAKAVVKGVGKDAPATVNAKGGKQSALPYRTDLLPPLACLSVSEVLAGGARKYGENNWHKIGVREHLNHVLTHLFAYLAGDGSDDHLEHAACRALMALEIKLREAKGADKPAPAPAVEGDWPKGFEPPGEGWTYGGDRCKCPDCEKYRACLSAEGK
jgi:hypothetical protein